MKGLESLFGHPCLMRTLSITATQKFILTAPPCHRPRRVREVFRRFREVFGAKLCQNAFQTIPVNSIFGDKNFSSTICFRVGHRFSSFWASFGASTGKRTSPSTSPQFFALDAVIMRSVRPKIDENCPPRTLHGGRGKHTWRGENPG